MSVILKFIYLYLFSLLYVACHTYYLMIQTKGSFYKKEFKNFYLLFHKKLIFNPLYSFYALYCVFTQQKMFVSLKFMQKTVEKELVKTSKSLIFSRDYTPKEYQKNEHKMLIEKLENQMEDYKEALEEIYFQLGYKSLHLSKEVLND